MQLSRALINAVLHNEDIESLVASGAPSDEYSDEADKIYSAVSTLKQAQMNEANIVAIISLVWAKAFNRSAEEIEQRLPAFKRITQKLLQL